MKKLFLLATIILSFAACETKENELEGTKWSYNNVDFIEFLEDNEVYMHGVSGDDRGTYEVSGSTVDFNDCVLHYNGIDITFTGATFTKKELNVKFSTPYNSGELIYEKD